MFSTLIEKILLEFLGDYIDGIKNSMDVALLKGIIKIENVSLKKDFFNNLSLPLRLAFSLIESIHIHIPWSNLKEKPTIVEVDGIYALFYVNYELEEYQFDPEKRLNEMIDKATQLIRMKLQEKQRDSESTVEKYILRIIDNVKVSVKNIHVRMQSIQRKWDFSMGLMLDDIEVYTSNEKGERHFFVRSRRHGHIFLHHRKEKHDKDDELFKKVFVKNVRLYFTQYETNFITLLEGAQHKLKEMKAMLLNDREMLLGQERARNQPNIVLRINLEAIIKAKLNETTRKYDIDVQTNIYPLTLNLTDRMTADVFYFLQFAFEWQMRKYKRPGNLVATSLQMINFYKLMLYNILSSTPIHQGDYKNLLRVVREWQYEFLNQMTIEFVQQQKVKKQLSRRKNRKISGDVVMLEQFKKEIEDRILTEEEKKQIFEIIGRVGMEMNVPLMQVILTRSKVECDIFAQRQQQVLKIGCSGYSFKSSTLWQKQQMFTMQIDDLVYFNQTQPIQRKISQQPLHEIISHAPFLRLIYTKQVEQKVQSISLKVEKRLIRINQRLVEKLVQWVGSIKLRPATVNYLQEIFVHYTSEIVKVLLENLFKEFRVVDLNIDLPVVEVAVSGQSGVLNQIRRRQDTLRVDFGRFQGKMLQQGMYHFQFTEDTTLRINNKTIASITAGTSIQILDKKPSPIVTNQQQQLLQQVPITHYLIEDRQKIMLKVTDLIIHHIDTLIDFSCTLIQSPILQQFLRMRIIDDQSVLLQGVFYLNNNPRRQRILMRNDSLYFLPSKYKISLKLCKVYKMNVQMRNCLVFHQFMSNIADVVEVENQLALDTIFYKIREQIHDLATTSEWDKFYKADYPVTIDRLDVLKSHHGENQPLFNFECFIARVLIPLERYLHRSQSERGAYQHNESMELKLRGKNALQLLKFFQSPQSDQHMYGRKTSLIEISQIYTKLSCYQLTKDLFADVKQVRLVVQDQVIMDRFGFSLSLFKAQSFLLNVTINEFQLSIQDKERLKQLIEIGAYFEGKVEELVSTATQCGLFNMIERSLRDNNNLDISALSSSHNISQHDASRMSSYSPKGTFRMQHSFLLTLTMTIKLNSFRMNILNYITQMRNVQQHVEIYRSENFPLIKFKAQNVILMSALQLNNLQLRIEKNYTMKESRIDCGFDVDRIRTVFNIEVLVMDLTQGEMGELICYVLDKLGQRREHEMIKVGRREEPHVEPHVRFDDFISPIKSIPSTTKKQPLQSMKSIHEQMMMSERQVNTINLLLSIKEFESQMIMGESQNSINFKGLLITLKGNTLSIGNIKATQHDQTLMSCKSIVITLPQHKHEIQQPFGQDILEQDIPDEFQSPRKGWGQEPLVQHKIMQPQYLDTLDNTNVTINGLQINSYVNVIGDFMSFLQQCAILIRRSTQFAHLRQNISNILLKTLQKRQEIQKVIDVSKQKISQLTQNIQKSYQSHTQFNFSIDLQKIFKYITIQTNEPIIISIFSHDQTQLLSSSIDIKIDFPNFTQSSIIMEVSHFNKMLHIFQPILERTQINVQRVKEQIQVNFIQSLKVVLSEQFLVDSLKQAEYISLKVNNKEGSKGMVLQNNNVVQELNLRKRKLYQRYTPSIWVQQTLQDLQKKQSKIIQNQFSLQPDILTSRKLLLQKVGKNCSKMQVKNYTGCGIVCELSQDSLQVQQLRVLQQEKHVQKIEGQYFVIPFDMKKEARFTSNVDFIDRQKPMRLKVRFESYVLLFTQSLFEMDILFGQVCRVGAKSQCFQLLYKYSSGGLEQQEVKSTMIEVVISFNRQMEAFAMEIRPMVQVINCTILDVGLKNQQQHLRGQSVSGQLSVLKKNTTKYLPFWVNSTLNFNLPHYHASQFQDSYKLPLSSQQNLQQNYPNQNALILKQSLIHYFTVLLGTQKCWIPLVFVKIKKYERYFDEKRKNKWDFRQTKCRLLILPFIKMENHLEKSLWVNGEVHLGKKERKLQRNQSLSLSSNKEIYQHQNQQQQQHQQQAIYFFLISQVDKSITHLMLSFSSQGYNYHIPLPQHLYVPKPLTFPTQGESLTPIAFNFLSTKNTYDQIILHLYPLIQISMEIPLKGVDLRMTTRVDEKGKEKDCQGLMVGQHKEQQQNKSEFDKLGLLAREQRICYLISQQYKLIKLQLLIDANLESKDTFYFTSVIPDKKSLSFINLFGDQFKKASTSSSQTSNEQQSSSKGSSQSLGSSSSHSNSQPSSQQSISSIFSQQSQPGTLKSIATRQLFIPTITQNGQMLFCHCLIKRREKRFFMQEELPNVCTVDVINQLRLSEQGKRKYEKYFQFEIVWLNQEQLNKNKEINENRAKLIEEEFVSEIKDVPKLKEIEQTLTKKLSSKLINIFINNLNLSLIVNKSHLPSSSFQNDAFSSSSFATSQRFQLINMTLGEICASLSFTIDDLANDIYHIEVQQQIGKLIVNSINCQHYFNESILKLNEHKTINLVLGFSMGSVFSLDYKDINRRQKYEEGEENLNLYPPFVLNKMLLKIVDLHEKEQKPNDYHFNIKVTDHFILQMFNWLIKMYPRISSVVTPNTQKSLLEIILESDTLNEFLQQFDGLMLCEEIKLKLSFISVNKKNSSLNIKKTKKINKEAQNKKVQNFLMSILQQNVPQQFFGSQVETAIRQSKTMQRILKYIKKIPFSVLQVENSSISIPQIAINGKLEKETLGKFERQTMINFATGIIKGMKLLGSPSSVMNYLQKNKNKKKRQKLSGLLNKLAKGSIISFTGIIKSISNGISQLTFDDKFLEQRQETMENSKVTEKSSKSNQGLKSLFLGIKSGFTGLVQQPVQNYQEEGAQGLVKGTIKGLTGLFTKPLTGILDLGTKALQHVGTQNKDSLNKRFNLLELQKTTYCRPLFYECSLIRGFTQSQCLAFIVLKSTFGNDKEFGQISAFELKQNPFNFEQKHIEKQNVALKLLDPIRYLLCISYDKTYFIQIGNEKDHRLIYNQIDHKFIKVIGRDQKNVCLVVQKRNIDNDEVEEENLQKDQINEIILNPLYLDEKQEIFKIYKKLTKK